MKKLMLALAIAGAGSATAQVKKTAAPAKPAVPVFKNATDSFSYAAGLSVAESMKGAGVEKLNAQLCAQAMNDVFTSKKVLLTKEEANMTLQSKLKEYADNKASSMKASGVAFLEANKKRTGVKELPGGIQYEVMKAGEPNGIKPKDVDTVVVNYIGTLIDGTEFDNSIKRGAPATFPLRGVIRGWTETLQYMTKGDHWKVYIPEDLAYGANPPTQAIPPYSVLIFEITLEDIKQATPAASK
jgi:FKBP-type peptidyl-prolyl cis-trans isomerase FklB